MEKINKNDEHYRMLNNVMADPDGREFIKWIFENTFLFKPIMGKGEAELARKTAKQEIANMIFNDCSMANHELAYKIAKEYQFYSNQKEFE